MDIPEIRGWFRLSKLDIPARKSLNLVDHFGTPEAVFQASESQLRAVEGVTDGIVARVLAPQPDGLDKAFDSLLESDICMLTVRDEDYPPNLRQIHDPPIVLYVRGELRESDRFSVAIVGSRRASIYGKSMCERISKDLVNRGLCIVSGGARGVDASAHKGALDAGGRTVAVLGCGIDVAYPAEHKELFARVARSGAVVSEFPPGTNPEGWRFPSRNRIISGLATALLVIQAPSDSGALITARFAAEHGKDIFALPGNVDDIRNQGCHALIRDGAGLVTCAEDITNALGMRAEENRQPQLALGFEQLTGVERALVELLSLQPKHVDQIIKESSTPAQTVTGTLTILEMKGLVKRVPGNAYVRAL